MVARSVGLVAVSECVTKECIVAITRRVKQTTHAHGKLVNKQNEEWNTFVYCHKFGTVQIVKSLPILISNHVDWVWSPKLTRIYQIRCRHVCLSLLLLYVLTKLIQQTNYANVGVAPNAIASLPVLWRYVLDMTCYKPCNKDREWERERDAVQCMRVRQKLTESWCLLDRRRLLSQHPAPFRCNTTVYVMVDRSW